MDQKRLFIAVRIPPETGLPEHLVSVRNHLSTEKISWTDHNQMHLTLKFLGETPVDKIPDLCSAMEEAFQAFPAFDYHVGSLGVFGSSYQPRVLWSGLQPKAHFVALYTELKFALQKTGIAYDRQNFVPHVTLGRIRNIEDKKKLSFLTNAYSGQILGEGRVFEVLLYESILHPTGPEYNILFRIPLRTV